MKKYNRLFLLVLTAISLALFLIYRREYNRLHYVLEVFNFFGQPCNITHLQRNGGTVLSHHDWGPSPLWTPLPGGYVYSAFLTGPNEVKALSLITEEKLMARSCFMWFEDKKRPVTGKFRYSKGVVNRRAGTMLGAFVCSVAGGDNAKTGNLSAPQHQQPYAVSFGFKKEKFSELKKIMLTQTFGRANIFNSTVCVAPVSHNKRQLVEFLSYHKLLGVSSFIIYNKDIPHRLVTLLLNLSPMLDVKITLMPWNYPKLDSLLTRAVVEQDCLLRTFGQTTYVTVLEFNEFIVPKTAYSFNGMMQTFQSKAERVSLPVKKFCVSNLEAKKPVALSNTDSLVSIGNSSVSIYESAKSTNPLVTLLVHDTQAAIHKYVKCPSDTPKTLADSSILKFSTDFVRTTLFQLFLHEQI